MATTSPVDNKGNPIKKYEPYFSSTSAYESEAAIVATGVTPILRYDPLGRLVRTDFPDGTFSKVLFDAWKEETWDQNDCVLGTVWYAEHSATTASAQDQRAATLAAAHANTPTTTYYETLGRAVAVVQHNGLDGASPPAAILYETHTTLDILGNALEVVDARGNTPLAQRYDLLKRPIRVQSAEAGTSKVLPDIAGVPVRSWNSRNVATRTTFDALRRPTHAYAKIDTASETLVQQTLYGEELGSTASKSANLRGQMYRSYDSAGVLTHVSHDFKGNLLEQQRSLATDYTTTPDWSASPSVETAIFTKSSTYDALNRVVTSTTPDASVAEPSYNEANQLVAMDVMVRGATSATSFVTDIFYNARGQRTKIAHANGVLTEYTYDAKTFRLTRLVSTRTSDSVVIQDLRYWYDPVGNIVETKDYAQQTVYFSNAVVSPDSKYEYDPLYRLTYAEGREHPAHSGSMTSDAEYSTNPDSLPHPNDLQVLRRYTEEFQYDGVGNILELVHSTTASAPNGWTRWYQYATASNKLTGTSDTGDTQGASYANTTTYTDAYTHDARGNMTSMPHLTAMEWDFADRLQHCDLVGGGDTYFTYDAAGQRVRKVWEKQAGLIEERIYVGGYEVWRKRVSGTLDEERQTLHVMDDQRRVAMVETKTVNGGSTVASPTSYLRYQLDDHLGSARVEVDGSGALLTYEEYHPYGTTAFRASSGASGFAPKRYRYTGKERDEETGLYYYGARYYPPWLGRWTATDPGRDGINEYEYVGGNPVRFNDPTGMFITDPGEAAELSSGGPTSSKMASSPTMSSQGKSSADVTPSAGMSKAPPPTKPKAPLMASGTSGNKIIDSVSSGTGVTLAQGDAILTPDPEAALASKAVKPMTPGEKAEYGALVAAKAKEKAADDYQRSKYAASFEIGVISPAAGLFVFFAGSVPSDHPSMPADVGDASLAISVGGAAATGAIAPRSAARTSVGGSEVRLSSSDALAGVEPASPELIESVSAKRNVQIVAAGSEEEAYLNFIGAEANVGGPNMDHILLRPNPSKAALLEEFLHGTQHKVGIIERLGTSGAEYHVKDFMIRHQKLLGLSAEDVDRLRILRDMGL